MFHERRGGSLGPPCPYEVAEGSSLTFDADDVVAAATLHVEEVTRPDDGHVGGWPVALDHTFTLDGEAVEVDLGTPERAECPEGRALLVPVVHSHAGTIDGLEVASETRGIALLATDARLDAIAAANRLDEAEFVRVTDADPALVSAAFAEEYADCDVADRSLMLSPDPTVRFAGWWEVQARAGALSLICESSSRRGPTWGEATQPPSQVK